MIDKMKRILLLIVIGILILPIHYSNVEIVLADSTTYYVDNDGDDSNDGLSPSTPWRTIGKINTELNGGVINQGDDIYFKRGDTFTDTGLGIRLGGTSSDWMIIGAYGSGADPIISGNSVNGNNVKIVAGSIGYIKVHDLDLRNSNANSFQCIETGLHNITVFNVDILNSGTSGMRISRTDHYKVENCTVTNAGLGGILIYGAAGGTLSRNGKLLNCTVTDSATDGFTHHDAGAGLDIGANHYIYNCVSSGSGENGFDITSGSNFYVQDCTAYDNSISPFVLGHDVQEIVIDNFYGYDDSYGFLATEAHDVIIRNSVYTFPDGGNAYIIYIYGKDGDEQTTDLAIYNNNLIWDSGTGVVTLHRDILNLNFKNNIFHSIGNTYPGTFVNIVQGTLSSYNMYWDNNIFWRGDGGAGDDTWWSINGVTHNYAQWLAEARVTGDLRVDAMMVDPANEDFTLQSGSPAIDAGAWLTATNGGGTGATITIDEANYFSDGLTNMPGSDIVGDNIFVGDDTNLEITSVNYNAETITVNRSITWSDGDDVSLSSYNGSAPDIGAYESQSIGQLPSFPVISNILRAESDPLDTEASFGWINITAMVTSDSGVNIVMCDVSLPNGSNTNVSMIQIGSNTYYHNTSTIFSTHGSHSYFIWANDTYGNATISSSYDFSMSPNWDIDMNGVCNILDFILVSNHYNETGSPGWIREDVDNNGIIDVLDFVQVSQHYFETW
ncbi:Right handed beta helix region [Thermoplasmatales archaeon SCGC AB-540-F20]|nr:Right handed beta helix region [Thermoplasmatales archaeon SCGC AB-540-F20]